MVKTESKKQIRVFLKENPKYKKILERILISEGKLMEEDGWNSYENMESSINAWEWSDVNVHPSQLNKLIVCGIIAKTYDSNNSTQYRVKDRESVKAALKELREEKERYKSKIQSEKVEIRKLEVRREDIEKFKEISKNKPLDYFKDFVSPNIKNRDNVKKAILLQLASSWDSKNEKLRINTLLYGESGTGKSAFKNFLVEKLGAIDIEGSRASSADMTLNKNTGELGALARAHHNILAVEEADELKNEVFGSILTSIGETGYVKIRDKRIKSETKALLLANDTSDWSPEALNRFTFKIRMENLSDEKLDGALDFRYRYWDRNKPKNNSKMLRKYLKWIKDFKPELTEVKKIQEFKKEKIDQINDMRAGLEIMRVATALARLRKQDIDLEIYRRAFRLYKKINSDRK